MQIKVRAFGDLDQKLGVQGSTPLVITDAPRDTTVRTLLENYGLTENGGYLVLVNGKYSGFDAKLADGDEILLFPPLEGG